MIWSLKTKDEMVRLTADNLIELLVAKVISEERPDHESLSKAFTDYLQRNQSLSTVSINQLAVMAFEIGYFYRLFKERNAVEVEENNEKSNDVSHQSTENKVCTE